ncbi:ATP-grasp domain-containing protein [Thermovibrio guaymasensis]|uniref:ATP-grasp domain-containing protein n=1 Tax=Thermovibrio guaymasensis TaxID=240167 RepID=A0A420W9T3_9BACT|nr:ATP-grasp domain-containing protein [Thermovibrio guaymasensis]RKQ64032.1 ATP-grasp domain-containing protein [Thermovibrio guaymasensis]
MKKALILGGSHRDIPLIMAAKKLGYFVITLGNRDYYVGHMFSDKSYKIDFNDLDKVSAIVMDEKVDVLIPGCGEKALINTIILGKKHKIGNFDSLNVINIIHNKWNFKKFCLTNNILVPKGVKVSSIEEIDAINISFPCIVKPLCLSGGRGVSVAKDRNALKKAIKLAQETSQEKEVLVEEFIDGKLIAYSVFVKDHDIAFDFVAKDDVYLNKFLITTAYPIKINNSSLGILRENVKKIIQLLGLKDGPFHLQVILKNNIPYIIDVSRRIPGDLFPYLIEFSTGIKYSEATVKAFIGDRIEYSLLVASRKRFVVRHCLMASRNGVLKEIFVDSSLKRKIIYKIQLMNIGTEIKDYLRNQVGIYFFDFESEKEMIEVVQRINELVFPVVV